ncbi:MAG: FkbM family methyltransferase [Candidatus Omnitrophota bacterium]|jgi:FkbM family methyltransferase
MASSLKEFIKSNFPLFVSAVQDYRYLRDFRKSKFYLTSYGFKLSGNKAMADGKFEEEETFQLKGLLGDCDIFVDVGANIGFFSCLARSCGSQVIAIEPSTQNLNYLHANLKANGWDDVEVFPVGLSMRPGKGLLYGKSTGASLVKNWANNSASLGHAVSLNTLDILLGDRHKGKKLIIKIDVEGSELEVLKGALKTLTRLPSPVWIIEICFNENIPYGINPNFKTVFGIFWENGYYAQTFEKNARRVEENDIDRWIMNGKRDFGYVNYIFKR